ncbi:MAG: cytidine deaminase [Halanaerobiales bacterium]
MSNSKKEKLIEKAKLAKDNAYVPYSNFPLGAAVLTEDDNIYSGCNIENASYGLSNCAERTALFKAISEGEKNFKKLVLVTDRKKPVTPCGACRQVINEFGDDIEVIMIGKNGREKSCLSGELLPGFFRQEDMEDDI